MQGRRNSLTYSLAGLSAVWKSEEAFRLECFIGIVLIPLGFWLGDSGLERAILIFPVILVLIVELLNTAVEVVVDRIGTAYHPLSKRAKDIGSAAVFLSLLGVGMIWAAVLI